MTFGLKILPFAKGDIQDSIRWYNRKQHGLGARFHAEVKQTFEHLKTYPHFQNRYDDVRCIPLNKFPFMVHYTVSVENTQVVVHAVFHTSLHPKLWTGRKGQQ